MAGHLNRALQIRTFREAAQFGRGKQFAARETGVHWSLLMVLCKTGAVCRKRKVSRVGDNAHIRQFA